MMPAACINHLPLKLTKQINNLYLHSLLNTFLWITRSHQEGTLFVLCSPLTCLIFHLTDQDLHHVLLPILSEISRSIDLAKGTTNYETLITITPSLPFSSLIYSIHNKKQLC